MNRPHAVSASTANPFGEDEATDALPLNTRQQIEVQMSGVPFGNPLRRPNRVVNHECAPLIDRPIRRWDGARILVSGAKVGPPLLFEAISPIVRVGSAYRKSGNPLLVLHYKGKAWIKQRIRCGIYMPDELPITVQARRIIALVTCCKRDHVKRVEISGLERPYFEHPACDFLSPIPPTGRISRPTSRAPH